MDSFRQLLSESDPTFWLPCVQHLSVEVRHWADWLNITLNVALIVNMLNHNCKMWDHIRTNVEHRAPKKLDHLETKSWWKLSAGFTKWVCHVKKDFRLPSVKFKFFPRLPLKLGQAQLLIGLRRLAGMWLGLI